jgi:hypothetical protein
MRASRRSLATLGSIGALIGCASPSPPPPPPKPVVPVVPADTVKVPLIDLLGNTYHGHAGGLYPGGTNFPPADHDSVAKLRRNTIKPLDVNGDESPFGKFVLLSIGSSNTSREWCSSASGPPCSASSFMGRAAQDASVNHYTMVIVNGAAEGQDAAQWTSPTSPNYERIKVGRLAPLGLSENQVQAVWLDLFDAKPTASLPADSADANTLLANLGMVMRALRAHYPYLRLVFVSSREYGGYATIDLNPEPYAYESGFAVKSLIESQINEMRGQPPNPRAGTLDYVKRAAPLLLWGPYLWAAGATPRSDGLVWLSTDFDADGFNPSQAGIAKVAEKLLDFFRNSPYTRCWFVNGGYCL